MSKEKLSKRTARLPMVESDQKAQDGGMYRVKRLQPLPISFDEERHKYLWEPTGEWMAHSVTEIVGATKDARAMANIMATKHVWEPRGLAVHAAMEALANGADPETLLGTEYEAWIKPLIEYPLWESFEPIATEYRLCDPRRSIGGSLDLLGWCHVTDSMMLIDLKTQSRSGRPYSTDPQMGGYLSCLIDRLGLVVDGCATLWCKPGETHLGGDQPPTQCLAAWEDSYSAWAMLQEEL
jgi:hypothetical protein